MNRRLFFGLVTQLGSAIYLAGCAAVGKSSEPEIFPTPRHPSGRRGYNGYDSNGYGVFSFGYGYGPIDHGSSHRTKRHRPHYGYGYGSPCSGYADDTMYCKTINWILTTD